MTSLKPNTTRDFSLSTITKKKLMNLYHQITNLTGKLFESLSRLHGLRNSTLSAQMPSESSSVVCNATNGVEPPRDYLSVKKSKKGTLKQIVPQYTTLKSNYTLLWDMVNMDGYLNIMAVIQKFFDQVHLHQHFLQPTTL